MTLVRFFLATLTALAFAGVSAAQTAAPVELKVMTFNIWYGGEQVNFPSVVEAIRRADADIVGIQEPDGNLERLADAAGYAHVDTRRNIISRFPLFDSGSGVRTDVGESPYSTVALDAAHLHAWAMVSPGYVVAIANTHLSSAPYGPEAVRDGASREEVLALEQRVRMPEARPLLALGALGQAGTPIVLTGDFNSPSYADWSAAMQRVRPGVIRYTVDWPVSHALADSGLRDTYREAHPDPAQRLGYTWTAGMPHPYMRPNETIDRIDFVFAAGPVRTLASQVIGEPGGDGVDIAISPYPSDHRAVVSRLSVTPIAAPALISVEPRTVARGDDILVRGYDPDSEGWRTEIVPAGASASNALLRDDEDVAAWRRAARFSSATLNPGEYDAILLAADGHELNRTRFAVRDPNAPVSLVASTSQVRAGAPVRVHWSNAPGFRFDWLGIFRAGAPAGDYLIARYIDARFAGDIDVPTTTDDGPLPAGAYEVRLMRDDSLTTLASAPFTIR